MAAELQDPGSSPPKGGGGMPTFATMQLAGQARPAPPGSSGTMLSFLEPVPVTSGYAPPPPIYLRMQQQMGTQVVPPPPSNPQPTLAQPSPRPVGGQEQVASQPKPQVQPQQGGGEEAPVQPQQPAAQAPQQSQPYTPPQGASYQPAQRPAQPQQPQMQTQSGNSRQMPSPEQPASSPPPPSGPPSQPGNATPDPVQSDTPQLQTGNEFHTQAKPNVQMFDTPQHATSEGQNYEIQGYQQGENFQRRPILGKDQTTGATVYGAWEDAQQEGQFDEQGNPLYITSSSDFNRDTVNDRQRIANLSPDQRKAEFEALRQKYAGRMVQGNHGDQPPPDAPLADRQAWNYLDQLTSNQTPEGQQALTARSSIYGQSLKESEAPDFYARYGINDPNHVSPLNQSQFYLANRNFDPNTYSTFQNGNFYASDPKFYDEYLGQNNMAYNNTRPTPRGPSFNRSPGSAADVTGSTGVRPPNNTSQMGAIGQGFAGAVGQPGAIGRGVTSGVGQIVNAPPPKPAPYGGQLPGGPGAFSGGGGGNSFLADLLRSRLTGFQGYNNPLMGDTQNLVHGMLTNPSPYDSQMLKDNYSMLSKQLDEQFGEGARRINETGAQRGLYDSSNVVGQLGDLDVQHDRARKDLALQLLTQRAQQFSQDQLNAVNAAGSFNQQGLNNFTANEGAYSNRLNQATGYDADLFDRSLRSAIFNNQMSEQDREFWLKMLGY